MRKILKDPRKKFLVEWSMTRSEIFEEIEKAIEAETNNMSVGLTAEHRRNLADILEDDKLCQKFARGYFTAWQDATGSEDGREEELEDLVCDFVSNNAKLRKLCNAIENEARDWNGNDPKI